jgi:hypothetical protein
VASTPSEKDTLEAAVAAAAIVLNADIAVAAADPTPANRAAVKALSERLNTAQQALNDYNALHGGTITPVGGVITISPTGVPSVGLPPPSTPPIINPTSTDVISTTAIAAGLNGYFNGDDESVANYIDETGDQPSIDNAWDYFVNQIEEVFANDEGLLEATAGTAFGVETGITVAEVGAGVTAEIGGIEAVGFAGALLLGEYVFGWILQRVGEGFPNPSIFGFRPLNFILVGITSIGNKIGNAATQQAEFVINILIQPIRMLVGLFGRAVNAIAGAHDKTARIVQHTVPTALQNAKDYTDQQLTDYQNVIAGDAETALAAMQPPPDIAQARQIIANANQYGTLVWRLEALAAGAIIAAGTYTDNTATQTQAQIAAAKAQAETDAQNAIKSAQADLISRLTGDETTLSAISNELVTTIPNEIATQASENTATENQALTAQVSGLQSQITALQSQITTLANQNATATVAITNATATLNELQAQGELDEGAIAQQQQIITAAQTTIANNTTAISDLYTQMTSISDTLAPIQAQQQLQASQISTINTDLDLTIPAALATLSTTLTNLKTQVDECSVDNCDTTNPNNIRNVLRDLLALFTATAEIGFIAQAINDPLGTANALAPILDSIDSSALSTLDLLLEL